MKPELYRNVKNVCAEILTFVLLAGATGNPVLATCTSGPGNAINTLAGTGASIQKIASSDNNTYILTLTTPDPYMYWRTSSRDDFGSQSISCFMDYWDTHFSDSELDAIVWGSSKPACAKISSLSYDNGVITAVLKRPNRYSQAPSASGEVAIEINRACNPSLPCLGTTDLTGNCYAPFFFNTIPRSFTASAPGAALNYAIFDNASMPNSNLKGTGLSNASFVGANLRGTNFDDAVMVYTDFTDADMTDAHAYGAFVYKTIAPNGKVVNSVGALLNGTPTTTTTTTGFSNNHFSLYALTSLNPPQTFSIPFVNSILNDPSEFHAFIFLTVGAGTVHLTVEPESPVDLQYGIAGFIGLTPITGYSSYGDPIVTVVSVLDFGFGVVFMATLPAAIPVIGADYPVIMKVDMSLTSP